jgi:hypothetical protein
MGSVGGKTPTEPKVKLMLCALFIYIIGGKIKRLSMNVAFKYIYKKG